MKDIADFDENRDTFMSINNHSIVIDFKDRPTSELETIQNKRQKQNFSHINHLLTYKTRLNGGGNLPQVQKVVSKDKKKDAYFRSSSCIGGPRASSDLSINGLGGNLPNSIKRNAYKNVIHGSTLDQLNKLYLSQQSEIQMLEQKIKANPPIMRAKMTEI